MRKITNVAVALSIFLLAPAVSAKVSITELLKQVPGEKLSSPIPLSGKADGAEYEIKLHDEKVESISIRFSPFADVKPHLSPSAKGYCLTEFAASDVKVPNYLFIDEGKTKRYELRDGSKLAEIIVASFDRVDQKNRCTLKKYVFPKDPK